MQVVVATVVSYVFQFEPRFDVKIVKDIPPGWVHIIYMYIYMYLVILASLHENILTQCTVYISRVLIINSKRIDPLEFVAPKPSHSTYSWYKVYVNGVSKNLERQMLN